MAALHILILSAIPVCLAQFSIQGPSDGNRAAQGLRYSEEKGIEYSDQSASSGSGDFSIQGATDGNSNFHIQGASDGNADFKIQGASDGNANFQIQGATDGNADFQIQGPTDGNAKYDVQESIKHGGYQSAIQAPHYQTNQGDHRSLQYDDTNGFKLNWKSYAHGQLSPQPQQQQQPQQLQHPQPAYAQNQAEARYAPEPAPRPVAQPAPQPTHQGEERAEVEQPISYRPYDNVPAQIKQLLQFQSQIPYLNAIPEHLRYDALGHQPQDHNQAQSQPQEAAPPTQRRPKPRGHQRAKRQAQQHQSQQQQPQQQYRRIPQPNAEPAPRYSSNVPSQIKQLLQFQSQIPYLNAIPEQFRYNLESAPVPVQPHQSQGGAQGASQGNHQRGKRQAHQQQQQQQQPQQQYKRISQPAAEPQPHYSTNLPSQIKQLLQFQSQIPYVNAIPEHFRYENLPAQPQHQNSPSNGDHQRGKRQAQNHPQQQQQHQQQQYKRISQPPPEPQPNYSTNIPPQIKQLLQFQSQIPYVNAIPEHFRYENLPAQPQQKNLPEAGGHQRGKRQAQNHPQQQQQQQQQQYKRISQPPPEPQPNYSTNVPSQIKQLLQFQSQIPYVNAIPEQFRYNLENAQYPAQDGAQGGHQRGKREAQSSQQGHAGLEQYRRIPQPAPESQPQYSANLPSSIQQLLDFQAQTPYNIIANQIIYRPDEPYVPQPAPSQASNYQGQNHGDVRPVTEHK